MKWVAYTDGSCRTSTKEGGLGVVILKDEEIVKMYAKQYKDVTNQKMELGAIIIALSIISNLAKEDDEIEIVSDSAYALGCAQHPEWKVNKNHLLRYRLNDTISSIKIPIKFTWVKGHNGNKYNEMADGLACGNIIV